MSVNAHRDDPFFADRMVSWFLNTNLSIRKEKKFLKIKN